jgi:succinoglycan biosynthesis protein ExoW
MQAIDIAAVVPHFQRQPGLLTAALRSAFSQSIAERLCVVICDDSSPSPAANEVRALQNLPQDRIHIYHQPNGGAGAARNTALSKVPAGVRYVAFLDSDDTWRPHHLSEAVAALELGYDAYFADFVAVGYPNIGNMARIGTLKAHEHKLLDASKRLHELSVSPIEHQVSDGGGLIQTSTVVYRFDKFPVLRFREEFFNGQDFFFWMDLSELGGRFAFSFEIECDNGEGINIFQASGWGTEKSLQRLRNELFVWTSVERFYALSPAMLRANKRTIRSLQCSVGLDVLHRLRHGKPISIKLLSDIFFMAPSSLHVALWALLRLVLARLAPKNA